MSRGQLLAAGLSPDAIKHRLNTGRLHLLHRGVYAVGNVGLTQSASDLAAVLACGPAAVLSHRSAAAVWELLPPPDQPEVTVPSRRRVVRPGITVHRADELPGRDVRMRDGIPVTAPERTILDLAATRDLDRALNEALLRRLVNPATLLTRAVGRPGARAIRSLLDQGPTPTRSDPERRFFQLVDRAALPRPRTNVRVEGREVDALWAEQRVVVEVDGFAFHSGRAAFERDRRRDAELQAAGYRVLRFTWRQITGRPEAVIAQLAATLRA